MRDEFLAEAQEIIESLSRDLLLLDHAQKEGQQDPDLVNEIFRGVHTLKGIAGMFGYHQVGAVAHALEDLLDDLRLGRIELGQQVLDVLFEGVENFQRLLAVEGKSTTEQGELNLEQFAESIERVASTRRSQLPGIEHYDLDSNVLSVLTEYEEHRLRTNVEQGTPLYRLRVRLSLASIDTALEDLKARAKPIAEIITYLPSTDGTDGDAIELDLLLASRAGEKELHEALVTSESSLTPIGQRADADGNTTITRPPSAPAPTQRREVSDKPAPVLEPSPMLEAKAEGIHRDMNVDQLSLRSVANTVRVDIGKLDHLMNVVGELAIVRSAVARLTERIRGRPEYRQLATDLHRINRGFERRLGELQDGILEVRMVPLGQVFDKLARVVRQAARENEKDIRLVVTGAETEVDKLIVEELSDPLMHIIRNAIDHGVELPKVRELAGKVPTGTLNLSARQKGNHVVIEVDDDGAGINDRTIIETAVRKGVVTRAQSETMSRDEIIKIIFLPGFSTRSSITDLSGRGVGMDVVKTNISRLGGVIDVHSEVGVGTKFTITLPITLAIISALLVRIVGRIFAIPLTSVQEAIMLDPSLVKTIEGREMITLRGATLPICRLGKLFNFLRSDTAPASIKQYVVVTALSHRRVGFVVDSLEGQQDIVIKATGKSLRGVRGFAGATDIGDQRVALVLDAPALIEEVISGAERPLLMGAAS